MSRCEIAGKPKLLTCRKSHQSFTVYESTPFFIGIMSTYSMGTSLSTRFVIDRSFDSEGYWSIREFFKLIDVPNFVTPTTASEVKQRIDRIHLEQGVFMAQQTRDIAKAWHKKETEFIRLATMHFEVEDFPNSEYICYPTIWPLVARDPVHHRIAFPYRAKSNEATYVIAHELLHEFLYHHLARIFGNRINLSSRHVWDFAETFNVLLMNERPWQEIFPFPAKPYSLHQKLLNQLSDQWKIDPTVNTLIGKFSSILLQH